MPDVLLLTGAAGRVAEVLRPSLRERWSLRLTDLVEPGTPPAPGETFLPGDLRDPDFPAAATEGVAAIVHLGGVPSPGADWPELIETNVAGSTRLLEAARSRSVRRIVIASSVHAVGGYNTPDQWPVHPSWPIRPCCPYGAGKAAMEAAARLYSDEVPDARVVCLRFSLTAHAPAYRHHAQACLADPDLHSLVAASLATDQRFGIHFGASICPRARYDLTTAAAELGWRPAVRIDDSGLPDHPEPGEGRCRIWRP
ncbi:MAG TPA: NAD(P)-dependent oxidoreductase [Microlunatus sp.]|nr:NAD(P)-dependent oxidoreductase [Microlunatus sp.]